MCEDIEGEDIKLEEGDVLVDALGEQYIVTSEGLVNDVKELPDVD